MGDEMANRVKRPRNKYISSWFSRVNSQLSSCSSSQLSVSTPIGIGVTGQQSFDAPLFGSQMNEFVPNRNVNVIERDPRKLHPIWKYPVNEPEGIRKAYILLGPYQPKLKQYKLSPHGVQNRRFKYDWFDGHPWLEYSEDQDKIYCFPCFLFDKEDPHYTTFTIDGVRNWKSKNVLKLHVGFVSGPHHQAREKWYSLRSLTTQIERVFIKQTTKEVEHNRLRLKATIESLRLLANQGQAFRGHDEFDISLNVVNFKQVRKSYGRMARDDDRVVLENGPGNGKYTSPLVQKQLLNILGNRVSQMIREEVGNAKFCILVDEAVDMAGKEKMSIVLRFIDRFGLIRERFFKIVSVPNTTSLTLKLEIVQVLSMFNLQVENIRGQGYDGASNMSDIWNGL